MKADLWYCFAVKRSWKTSTICPACGHTLTFVDGIKAPTPFFIRCSRCRTNVRVHLPLLIPFLIVFVALFLPSVALVPMIADRFGTLWALLYSFWLLIGCLLAEAGTGVALFTFARFTVKGKAALPAATNVSQPPAVPEKTGGHWWTRYEKPTPEQNRAKLGHE